MHHINRKSGQIKSKTRTMEYINLFLTALQLDFKIVFAIWEELGCIQMLLHMNKDLRNYHCMCLR